MDAAVRLEWCGLMRDYRDIAHQYGTPVTVRIRLEAEVRRDGYSTIKSRSLAGSGDVQTYALPVEVSPDQRTLSKLGVREACEVAIQTPIIDWFPQVEARDPSELGRTFLALDMTRMTVEMDGQQYKVADRGMPYRIGERPLAISLALRRN